MNKEIEKDFKSKFIFKLKDIPEEGLSRSFKISAKEAQTFFFSSEIETDLKLAKPIICSPLFVLLKLYLLDDSLLIQGDINSIVQLTCDRCLIAYDFDLAFKIYESLKIEENLTEEDFLNYDCSEEEEHEFSVLLVNGHVDLCSLVSEYFWLAYPFKAICKPKCLGLCPLCGNDLNISQCLCLQKEKNISNVFGILENLIIKTNN